ncbi:hypothetical protein [Desulfosarcina cetonica]|nr:hypothetical protein [Desulfosarcina cetonica]
MSELTDNSGRLYDPQVVDACLALVNETGYTLKGKSVEPVAVTTQMQSL